MRKKFFIIFLLISAFSCNSQAGNSKTNELLKQIKSIPLPGVKGRIDHFSLNEKNKILYVAALGNNSVEVIDLNTGKVIHSIENLNEPQGVSYIPENNKLVVSNGGDGWVKFFNADSFKLVNKVKLSGDADNIRYDENEKKLYVGYGNGAIAIIDPISFQKIVDIALTGHPESFQIDKNSKKIYVNVPDTNQVEVIDLDQQKVIEKWLMVDIKANFPMALDETNHRLFIGARNPAKLKVINTETGKTISNLDIDRDIDDIFYNPENHLIYMSCGSGYIDIARQVNKDEYKVITKFATASGARTAFFVTSLKELFLAIPVYVLGNAEIREYKELN
jgi:YVTN family beta-propeller protein